MKIEIGRKTQAIIALLLMITVAGAIAEYGNNINIPGNFTGQNGIFSGDVSANDITVSGTVDGVDIASSINQGVRTTDSPTFNNVIVSGNVDGVDISASINQGVRTTDSPIFVGLNATDINADKIGGVIYADQYATIQDAINAGGDYSTILLSPGSFDIAGIVPKNNSTIQGSGKDSTIILPTVDIIAFLNMTYKQNITIKDLTIDGRGVVFGIEHNLLRIHGSKNITVQNVDLFGSYDALAINWEGGTYSNTVNIENLRAMYATYDGIYCGASYNVKMKNIEASNNAASGIETNCGELQMDTGAFNNNGVNGFLGQSADHYNIISNIVANDNTASGIVYVATGSPIESLQISNVYAEGNGNLGLLVEPNTYNASNISISGATLIQNSQAAGQNWGNLRIGTTGGKTTDTVTITNVIADMSTGKTQHANDNIYFRNASNLSFINSIVKNSNAYGIVIEGTDSNAYIQNNNIFGQSSDPILIVSGSVRAMQNANVPGYNHGNHATAPPQFGAGDTYYDTDVNYHCFYNSTAWVDVSTGLVTCS